MNRLLSAIAVGTVSLLASAAVAQDLRPLSSLHGPVRVLDVVDGDTVVLGSNLGPRTVRLIGIDAPEMSDGTRGLEARERLNALLGGRMVWAEIGTEPEDRYARLLAYLYVEDPAGRWDLGGVRATQVNLALVAGGWADTLTIPPNTAYAPLYAEARAEAAARGAGFWAQAQERPAGAEDPARPGHGGGHAGGEGPAQGAATAAAPAQGSAGPVRLHCALVNPSTPNDEGAEWVSVVLAEPTDTTGYYLWDEGSRSTFRLPGGLQPAGELRVVNPGQGAWNNSGDTIFLMRGGDVVDQWSYGPELAVNDRVACRDPAVPGRAP